MLNGTLDLNKGTIKMMRDFTNTNLNKNKKKKKLATIIILINSIIIVDCLAFNSC